MLTDYMVTCPHSGCHWSGSLLPKSNRDAWKTALPTTHSIVFQCPRCHGEWHARVVGEDAVPLPLDELTGILELAGTA
jgi:hypothetical protein